jgi:hypothetical protein
VRAEPLRLGIRYKDSEVVSYLLSREQGQQCSLAKFIVYFLRDKVCNTHPLSVELGENARTTINNWNIRVSEWLRECESHSLGKFFMQSQTSVELLVQLQYRCDGEGPSP